MNCHEQEQLSGAGDSNVSLEKLKRVLEQVRAGCGITKAMEELEAMEKMKAKVLQISYEPEHDRLTWDGWDIHCVQALDVLLPDRLDGGLWHIRFRAFGTDFYYYRAVSEDTVHLVESPWKWE